MSSSDAILSDIRAYIRISAASALRGSAGIVLDSVEKASVYSSLDGYASQQRIQELTGVPQATISRWIADFTQAGIVAPPDAIYKTARALFTIQELGIDMATLKRRTKSTAPAPSPAVRPQQSETLVQETV